MNSLLYLSTIAQVLSSMGFLIIGMLFVKKGMNDLGIKLFLPENVLEKGTED